MNRNIQIVIYYIGVYYCTIECQLEIYWGKVLVSLIYIGLFRILLLLQNLLKEFRDWNAFRTRTIVDSG